MLRGLVTEVRQMLAARTDEAPSDELAVLTGLQTDDPPDAAPTPLADGTSETLLGAPSTTMKDLGQ